MTSTTQKPAANVVLQRLQVLMVEDDPADAELCIRELRKAGYDAQVEVVQTAHDFADRLNSGAYHIVLGDYTLPAWSGIEALEMLQRMEKDLPFILLTGTMREEEAMRCAQRGAVDYVHKDRLARVALAVRLALERKALREEHAKLEENYRLIEQRLRQVEGEHPSSRASQSGSTPDGLAAFAKLNPNPVLEFSRDGRLTYCNDAAIQMAQSLGRAEVGDILPPDTSAIVLGCIETEQKKLRVLTSANGRTFSWSFYPIKQTQTVHCYVGDVTDRQQLEAQLRHSQKLESVGRLAGGIAHDFNNVLTVIQGRAGILQSEAGDHPIVAESVQHIARAAEEGRKLTGQLLAFSRRNVLQAQSLDLNEVLTGLSSLLHRTLGEDIAYQFDYASALPPVNADRGLIEQVIINLAVNARDAMPRGGQLVLNTSQVIVDQGHVERFATEAREGSFVCLSITDTGCGMDTLTLSRIFEPFFTTKEFGKGTGLGLATVYGIVKQHGGWIEVQSQIGQGTTFRIYLPPATEVIQVAAKSDRPLTGTETVLVVEDEPPVRWTIKDILTRYGYRVLEAGNGVEALALWHQHHSKIDLLLTDMVMPVGLTGRELADRFIEQKPSLKVIFISGYSPQAVGTSTLSESGVEFLQKPFDGPSLTQAIRKCLDSGRRP